MMCACDMPSPFTLLPLKKSEYFSPQSREKYSLFLYVWGERATSSPARLLLSGFLFTFLSR
jgi:hypothetical protein